MKTAILSMQRVVNFGSVLQAYSLRELVREATGETPDFIDIDDSIAFPSRKSIRSSDDYADPPAYSPVLAQRAKRWIIARFSACTKRKIRAFMKKELRLDDNNGSKSYDYVIVGSDEVFNHAKGVRLQLHGEVKQARKIVAYAASCGSAVPDDIFPENLQAVKNAMCRFSGISVRDEATQNYVAQLYDGVIEHHLDPVLVGKLVHRAPHKVPFKKYVLIYAYGQRIRTVEEIQAIQSFAKEKGLKTVAIGGSQFWCDFYIPVSPFRALDYFAFADYVITDTFHGSIFSIINHRKFGVLVRKTNAGKLGSLLKKLRLEERQIREMEQLTQIMQQDIRYDLVDEILVKERERTIEYLQRQLKGNDHEDE